MNPVLLFQALLDELSAERIPVGVREHLALGKLLQRYDGTSREQFRDAVAALFARNPDEVWRIKAAFDRLYPVPEDRPPPERRRWPWLVMVAGALVTAILAIWWLIPPPPPKPWLPVSGPPHPPPPPPPCTEVAPATTSSIETTHDNVFLAALGTAAILLAGGVVSARRGLRFRLYESSRTGADRLSRPRHYDLVVSHPLPRPERQSYGRFAQALQRQLVEASAARTLDVKRTLRETLRAFPRIAFVHRIRHIPRTVLVLEDVGEDMRPWRGKVVDLIAGLCREGLPILHLFFEGAPARVSTSRAGVRVPLERYERLYPGSPLLAITCSTLVPAALVQLDPVTDPGLWPAELRAGHVWPISAAGLAGAARALDSGDRRDHDLDEVPHVSSRDARLFAALAMLSPIASPELDEVVRAHLFPAVPEELVLAPRDGDHARALAWISTHRN